MKGGEGPIDLGKKRHENEVRGARSKKYAAHYDREEDGFVFPKKPIELNVTETFTLSRAILDRYTSDSGARKKIEKHRQYLKGSSEQFLRELLDQHAKEPNYFANDYIVAIAEEYLSRFPPGPSTT